MTMYLFIVIYTNDIININCIMYYFGYDYSPIII